MRKWENDRHKGGTVSTWSTDTVGRLRDSDRSRAEMAACSPTHLQ